MMKIERVAVIGSGTMGRGIAHVAMLAGYKVHFINRSEENLKIAVKDIEENLVKSIERGFVKQEEYAKIQNILSFTNIDEGVKNVELVIESVAENMDLKMDIFRKLDVLTNKDTILATNTSTMSPTEIASVTSKSDKVIGMHFFNPVHKMKLLEIVKGLNTSEETVDIALEVGKMMGKETVIVNEYPGFIPSRINCLIGNEAFYMLQEGVASAEDIDKALKLGLNHPMGPFELVDLVGLDVRLNNLEYLYKTLGEKYRPCPLMIKYVKAGRLGRKAGKGVYEYE